MFKKLLAICVVAGAAWGADNADPSEAFYAAIRGNDLTKLQAVLAGGASANHNDARGLTPLMYAAAVGSADAMKLLIEKGADVNAKNAFDSTALMWSVTDINKVRLLVAKGANVNAVSKQGHTAMLLAAMSDGSAAIVRLLIAEGANVKAVDNNKINGLLAASAANDLESVNLFVDAGLDVNSKDAADQTPLMNAAGRGNTAMVKWLLAKGADVNAVSAEKSGGMVKNGPIGLGKFTALILASTYGPAETVRALLDAGAEVNAKDIRGMTPLMYAVTSDHAEAAIVKLLLARGADVTVKSAAGETVADWARKSNAPAVLQALNLKPSTPVATLKIADSKTADLRSAVERSVGLLEKTSAKFLVEGGCFGCHAQNLTDIAVKVARSHGARVDEGALVARRGGVKGFLGPAAPALLERADPPGSPDTLLYLMTGMMSSGYEADRVTDALVANIAAQQTRDGSWHIGGIARPPMEDGDFFRATLAIRAMQVYGAPGRAEEWKDRIAKAKAWLLQAKAVTSEDRSMQLLGLVYAGADANTIAKLAKAIVADQRGDGGWGQRDSMACDAYATGQSLYALQAAGIKVSNPAYQKGVKFLLATQKDDGSWFVASRSAKFQPYFESSFPHGHNQWISSAATGWATAALAHALDSKPAALRVAE
jgi:ankyrin repeat protein